MAIAQASMTDRYRSILGFAFGYHFLLYRCTMWPEPPVVREYYFFRLRFISLPIMTSDIK